MDNEEKRNESEQVETAVHPEIEGSRYNWFYVCGDCHCVINWKEQVCPHCGRRIDWNV